MDYSDLMSSVINENENVGNAAMAAKQKAHGKTGPSSALLARLSSGKRAVIPRDEVSSITYVVPRDADVNAECHIVDGRQVAVQIVETYADVNKYAEHT